MGILPMPGTVFLTVQKAVFRAKMGLRRMDKMPMPREMAMPQGGRFSRNPRYSNPLHLLLA
jgi:hypothetical protein